MAQFQICHRVPTTTDAFWDELFLNDEFNRKLYLERLGFHRYDIEEKTVEADGRVRIRLITEPEVSLPGSLKHMVGDSLLYVEDGVLHRDENVYRFRIEAPKFKDKLQLSGELRVEAVGAQEIERVFSMDCRVNVFGVGRVIEGFIEKTTRESHDQAVAYTKQYLLAASSSTS